MTELFYGPFISREQAKAQGHKVVLHWCALQARACGSFDTANQCCRTCVWSAGRLSGP